MLFLPAAGCRSGNSYYVQNTEWDNHAVSAGTSGTSAVRAYGSANAFEIAQGIGRRWAYSVRLATVVSELVGVLILFLPAAGRSYGDDVGYVGEYCMLWAKDAKTDERGYQTNVRADKFDIGAGWDRFRGMSIRLATVVSELTGVMSSVPACCGASIRRRILG